MSKKQMKELLEYLFNKQANTPSSVRALLTAIAEGRKIEAIKEFRTLTGDGLKESLAAVDAVYRAAA
jgi:ribosomal protein L7/L12